jgi:hypothetical protein
MPAVMLGWCNWKASISGCDELGVIVRDYQLASCGTGRDTSSRRLRTSSAKTRCLGRNMLHRIAVSGTGAERRAKASKARMSVPYVGAASRYTNRGSILMLKDDVGCVLSLSGS